MISLFVAFGWCGARPALPSASGRGCFEGRKKCPGHGFGCYDCCLIEEKSMYAVLRIGTILCWAIAIGSEYVAQLWPQRKKLLNVFAAGCFAVALLGEYDSYRYDDPKQSQMEAAIKAQGVPAIELILKGISIFSCEMPSSRASAGNSGRRETSPSELKRKRNSSILKNR